MAAAYRDVKPEGLLSSDENSDFSDLDDDATVPKRTKKNDDKPTDMEVPFENPIVQQKQGPKKKNNIWGNVMQEQMLSQTISRGFEVNEYAEKNERDVESYNYKPFKRQYSDEDDYSEDDYEEGEEGTEDNRGKVKDRIGYRTKKTKDDNGDDEAEEDMDNATESENRGNVKDRLGYKTRKNRGEGDGENDMDGMEPEEEGSKDKKSNDRKRTVKDRLGQRKGQYIESDMKMTEEEERDEKEIDKIREELMLRGCDSGPIEATEDDSIAKVVNAMCHNLEEPQVALMYSVVLKVGKAKALSLMKEVFMIEESGGIMTNDQSRRRTPGGVFFYIMKDDPDISKEVQREIFTQGRKDIRQFAKRRKKHNKEWQRAKKRLEKESRSKDDKSREGTATTPMEDMESQAMDSQSCDPPEISLKPCAKNTDLTTLTSDTTKVEAKIPTPKDSEELEDGEIESDGD